MCSAGFIFAVQVAQWLCHKLITHCARRVAATAVYFWGDKESASQSTVNQENSLTQHQHQAQETSGDRGNNGGKTEQFPGQFNHETF